VLDGVFAPDWSELSGLLMLVETEGESDGVLVKAAVLKDVVWEGCRLKKTTLQPKSFFIFYFYLRCCLEGGRKIKEDLEERRLFKSRI